MNFGKYKGKSLKYIMSFDLQYILWCLKNIPNFKNRLNKENVVTLEYIVEPLKDIKITSISFEEMMNTLKQRGILNTYSDYVNYNDDLILEIDTIYGWCNHSERVSNIFIDKKQIVIEKLNRWINKINT